MTTNAWMVLAPVMALACSGETFGTANRDSTLRKDGGTSGASATGSGGASTTGGQAGSAGRRGAGGAQASGGASTSGGVTGSGGARASGGVGGSLGDGGPGGTGAASGGGGGATPKLCVGAGASFPSFVKACDSVTNCALVQHQTDCCGGALIMAINHGEVARFDAAEKICEAEYPACGCASQGVKAEDGTMVPWDKQSSIVAQCVNSTCQSKYGGKTFACGPLTCTDLDYCSVTTGGAAGSAPTYGCVPMGTCTSCACLPNSGACICRVAAIGSTVTCQVP
jgi:hypothetical protein